MLGSRMTLCLALFIALLLCPRVAEAQGSRVEDPRRATLLRMMQPLSIEVEEVRLEDFVDFLKSATGADIEAYWEADDRPNGLVRDTLISVNAREIPALDIIERVLERPLVVTDEFDEPTWQMSPAGAFEIGPRSRLNRRRASVIYDVRDLTFVFDDNQPPESLDLDSALDGGNGGGGGGGGGGGLFGGGGGGEDDDLNVGGNSGEEILQELIDILTEAIEPDQWVDAGGEGATLRVFRGDLLIRAPDYIHRQIDGYKWWPSGFEHRQSPMLSAMREHGTEPVLAGTAPVEPREFSFDQDGLAVRVIKPQGTADDDREPAEEPQPTGSTTPTEPASPTAPSD